MIDLAPHHLETVRRILTSSVPDYEVRAFGSRVSNAAKPYSDLDLVIVGQAALGADELRLLREEFENSDLPIRVDVVDWNTISASFREVIERNQFVLQASRAARSGRAE